MPRRKANASSLATDATGTSPTSPVEPCLIPVGKLLARRCAGEKVDATGTPRVHGKPFLGISDLAQLSFCEVQSTISQIATQGGYIAAAHLDDRKGGIGASPGHALDRNDQNRVQRQIKELVASGRSDWDTRALIGRLSEMLELSGVPTERRHFDCGDFYVIGVPDGLTQTLAIEFAASRYPHLSACGKQIQGNLYATLWGVPRYRVLIVHPERSERHDVEHAADPQGGEQWIRRGWAIFSGAAQPSPPDHKGKCTRCRFNRPGGCPYPRTGRIPGIEEMRRVGLGVS